LGRKAQNLPILKLFFPKVCYSTKVAGLLACVLLSTFSFAKANNGIADNNKLCSLQLREQLKIFDLSLSILNL
jgi:hypothetical protein